MVRTKEEVEEYKRKLSLRIELEIGELYAILYSQQQKCFHLETLGEYILKNKFAFLNGRCDGYKLLAIKEDFHEASDYIAKCNDLRERKGELDG